MTDGQTDRQTDKGIIIRPPPTSSGGALVVLPTLSALRLTYGLFKITCQYSLALGKKIMFQENQNLINTFLPGNL